MATIKLLETSRKINGIQSKDHFNETITKNLQRNFHEISGIFLAGSR